MLSTWSCLTFTPFTGHQSLNDLDVSIQAGFTTVEGGGRHKVKKINKKQAYVLQSRWQSLLLWFHCTGFSLMVIHGLTTLIVRHSWQVEKLQPTCVCSWKPRVPDRLHSVWVLSWNVSASVHVWESVCPRLAWLSLHACLSVCCQSVYLWQRMQRQRHEPAAAPIPTWWPVVWKTQGWRSRPGLWRWAGSWNSFGTLSRNASADSGELASTEGTGSACWQRDVAAGRIPQDSPLLLKQIRTGGQGGQCVKTDSVVKPFSVWRAAQTEGCFLRQWERWKKRRHV